MTLQMNHDILNYVNEASIILAKLYRADGYSKYYPKPTPTEIESWIKWDPEYDPLETAIVETSHGEVLGYAMAWNFEDYEPGFGRVVIDPDLPNPIYRHVLIELLRWMGNTLSYYDRASNPLTLHIGREYSKLHIHLLSLLGGRAIYTRSGALMEFRGSLNPNPPPGFREEVYTEIHDIRLVDEIRATVNDAFSIYPGHSEWTLERAWSYYTQLSRRRSGEFFMVTLWSGDELAGLAEIMHYEVQEGGRIGYVALLATRRKYQGRGIGSYLLGRAKGMLNRMGIEVLALDSVPKAQQLYEKLGFVPVIMWMKALVPTSALLSI